jgi:hypothetical protein
MKERLLLSWIALQRRHVIYRYAQMAAFIEANFADASLPFLDQTTMPAGEALQRVAGQMLGQLRRAFGRHLVQDFSE